QTPASPYAFPGTSPAKGHSCWICSRPFGRATDVKRHVDAVHLKLKNFVCPFCNRGFAQKGGMITHMNTHRSRHEFEAHAPPSFDCPEGCASFKRKDTLKGHIRDKHPNNTYPESLLANKMTRERFNAEYLPSAIEEYSGGSSAPEGPGDRRKVTVYKKRKLIVMDDDDDADDDGSSWSAQPSTVNINEAAETHVPSRRSDRLAGKPPKSMKEETPDLSRAPTASPYHSAIHPSATHSHHSTPIWASAAPSLRASRVPTPVPFISFAGRNTPAGASSSGTPSLTVPPFHHPYSSYSPSPLGSRGHSPGRPTEADLLVRHLATHDSHATPPISDLASSVSFHSAYAGTQASQALSNGTSLPRTSAANPVGLGLTNVNLSMPLSNYFDTETVLAPANGPIPLMSGYDSSGSLFGNYSFVNPQALHTPPAATPGPSTSYIPQYIHSTSALSPFSSHQILSPAPTIFNSSPFTPSYVAGEDLEEELRKMFSPERSLVGAEG
ncbi:hypothetical protein FRC01_012380, partial [Tulasnella sp. 417]